MATGKSQGDKVILSLVMFSLDFSPIHHFDFRSKFTKKKLGKTTLQNYCESYFDDWSSRNGESKLVELGFEWFDSGNFLVIQLICH